MANAARRVNLGEYLLLGKGERYGGGDKRASNLADAWEAGNCRDLFEFVFRSGAAGSFKIFKAGDGFGFSGILR